jgi:hypothetical protein
MSHVAVIVGVSGREFFLSREGKPTETAKQAQSFRSDGAAERAAKAHINTVEREFGKTVARYMSYRIQPKGEAQ